MKKLFKLVHVACMLVFVLFTAGTSSAQILGKKKKIRELEAQVNLNEKINEARLDSLRTLREYAEELQTIMWRTDSALRVAQDSLKMFRGVKPKKETITKDKKTTKTDPKDQKGPKAPVPTTDNKSKKVAVVNKTRITNGENE